MIAWDRLSQHLPVGLMDGLQLAWLSAAAKASLILVTVFAITLLLRRRGAALRHMILATGLGVTLILPAAAWLLPGWHPLPAWTNSDGGTESESSGNAPPAAPAFSPGFADEDALKRPKGLASNDGTPATKVNAPATNRGAENEATTASIPWSTLLFAVLITGSALLVMRLILSALCLARLARKPDRSNSRSRRRPLAPWLAKWVFHSLAFAA